MPLNGIESMGAVVLVYLHRAGQGLASMLIICMKIFTEPRQQDRYAGKLPCRMMGGLPPGKLCLLLIMTSSDADTSMLTARLDRQLQLTCSHYFGTQARACAQTIRVSVRGHGVRPRGKPAHTDQVIGYEPPHAGLEVRCNVSLLHSIHCRVACLFFLRSVHTTPLTLQPESVTDRVQTV